MLLMLQEQDGHPFYSKNYKTDFRPYIVEALLEALPGRPDDKRYVLVRKIMAVNFLWYNH